MLDKKIVVFLMGLIMVLSLVSGSVNALMVNVTRDSPNAVLDDYYRGGSVEQYNPTATPLGTAYVVDDSDGRSKWGYTFLNWTEINQTAYNINHVQFYFSPFDVNLYNTGQNYTIWFCYDNFYPGSPQESLPYTKGDLSWNNISTYLTNCSEKVFTTLNWNWADNDYQDFDLTDQINNSVDNPRSLAMLFIHFDPQNVNGATTRAYQNTGLDGNYPYLEFNLSEVTTSTTTSVSTTTTAYGRYDYYTDSWDYTFWTYIILALIFMTLFFVDKK